MRIVENVILGVVASLVVMVCFFFWRAGVWKGRYLDANDKYVELVKSIEKVKRPSTTIEEKPTQAIEFMKRAPDRFIKEHDQDYAVWDVVNNYVTFDSVFAVHPVDQKDNKLPKMEIGIHVKFVSKKPIPEGFWTGRIIPPSYLVKIDSFPVPIAPTKDMIAKAAAEMVREELAKAPPIYKRPFWHIGAGALITHGVIEKSWITFGVGAGMEIVPAVIKWIF